MEKERIFMTCGCELRRKDLKYIFKSPICPKHDDGRIDYIKKYCERCGEEFTISKMSFAKNICDTCNVEIEKNRVYHSYDRYLLPKKDDVCIEDILTNQVLGYEEIQINPSLTSISTSDPVMINLESKLLSLKQKIGVNYDHESFRSKTQLRREGPGFCDCR